MTEWQFYLRKEPILAIKLDEITFVKCNGYTVKGNKGDYLCSDKAKTEQWIIPPTIFYKTYKAFLKGKLETKQWNLYRELQPLKAKVLNQKIIIQNEESRKIGEKGDYLCTNRKGNLWIIPKEIINSNYLKLEKRNSFCW